jgi:hypothetical protein
VVRRVITSLDTGHHSTEETPMGLMKDVKTSTAGKDAARAVAQGRQVFVFQFDFAYSHTTQSVSGAAEVIEAIEAQGWRMDQMAVHPGVKNGAMIMTFRRHQPGTAGPAAASQARPAAGLEQGPQQRY